MRELRLKSGEVVTEEAYRASHANVSFPADFQPGDATWVVEVAPPVAGPGQRAIRKGVKKINGEWTQVWGTEALGSAELALIGEQSRAVAKQDRAAHLATVTVQVGDKTFDADETSLNRITRKIIEMTARDATETTWTLADNKRVVVTLDEMKKALVAAEGIYAKAWAN